MAPAVALEAEEDIEDLLGYKHNIVLRQNPTKIIVLFSFQIVKTNVMKTCIVPIEDSNFLTIFLMFLYYEFMFIAFQSLCCLIITKVKIKSTAFDFITSSSIAANKASHLLILVSNNSNISRSTFPNGINKSKFQQINLIKTTSEIHNKPLNKNGLSASYFDNTNIPHALFEMRCGIVNF